MAKAIAPTPTLKENNTKCFLKDQTIKEKIKLNKESTIAGMLISFNIFYYI